MLVTPNISVKLTATPLRRLSAIPRDFDELLKSIEELHSRVRAYA